MRITLLATAGLVAGACSRSSPEPAPVASASASAAPAVAARLAELSSAEARRASSEVREADLESRDPAVRRRAARALARIADDRAAELLGRSLSDEDPEVVAWSAYGLGWSCGGREPVTVRRLATRAASLAAEPPVAATAARASPAPAGRLDVITAIADGLGRCGTPEAERTLRGWLDGPRERAEAAALALGRLANREKRLDDATLVALLDAASGERPLTAALHPFTRLAALPGPIAERALDVAREAAAGDGAARALAVRALGRAGAAAADRHARVAAEGPGERADALAEKARIESSASEPLARVARDLALPAALRADAARELGRLGAGGQQALAGVLDALSGPEQLGPEQLRSPGFGPLLVALEAVTDARGARAPLERLADLAIPEPSDLRRRVVALRCRAADVLAGPAIQSPRLLACDPDPNGRAGALALLRVMDRAPITGARWKRWTALCASVDPVVRQAALGLLGAHAEIEGAPAAIAGALAAREDGTVAEAAALLAAHPERASRRQPGDADAGAAGAPAAEVTAALAAAFETRRAPDAIETVAALTDAAASLGVLSLKPRIEAQCASPNPTLRQHAEKALRVLGDKKRECKRFTASGPGAPAGTMPEAAAPRLVVSTDAGELALRLDPSLAPLASARVVELARSGFYDGVILHRVVPGFVVQFGDRGGDGYGGAGKEPLPCETSPLRFDPLAVGVALGGRDTGSSQIFVTLGAFPHLDGDYALIGRAEPGWDRAAQGDVIRKVRVE